MYVRFAEGRLVRGWSKWVAGAVMSAALLLGGTGPESVARGELRVGAAVVDVTPSQFPVLVNGGMTSNSATKVKTPVNARALVLDDGRERVAIVVVDSCMMARPFLDEAKQLAAQQTKIRPDRMLISATHTHSAPASMGCLGTDADPAYIPLLRIKLCEAIVAAEKNLEPARVGWGSIDAAEYTALRRWVRRPDRVEKDPFGNPTVRANMHAARNPDDVTGESGPEDPDLQLISFQAKDGRPLAVLGNFSMHYFSDSPISADYFGLFCEGLKQKLQKHTGSSVQPFVGLLSHGCSGDIWRRDYTKPIPTPAEDHTIESYTQGLLGLALTAYEKITYRDDADLAMSEARLELKYRVPDAQRLEWAKRVVAEMGDRLPKTVPEVYAREQIILHERQSTQIVVQALRIGEIAIATTPNETYALSGLKIKMKSPLAKTMVIELANGGDGYIPPPEQHLLGGYNTWAARSAGLEVQAERKIVETAVERLEAVAGKPRRKIELSRGPATEAALKLKPLAYWRLDEVAGPRVADATGNRRDGVYEPGVVFFLEGPQSSKYCLNGEKNRAAHFAGGRIESRFDDLGDRYSIAAWFWNGMPLDGRDTAGWIFSRGHDHGLGRHAEHLGLGGKNHAGKLTYLHGDADDPKNWAAGRTEIARWTWHHVVLVRDGGEVRVYLDGNPEPEIVAKTNGDQGVLAEQLFFGGRSDNQSNWEGRLDEIGIWNRPLTPKEIAELSK